MRQVLSRQVLGKGMLTAAAASSLLSIATGAAYAHTGATAEASHSPGVLAGNSVSVPVTFAPNVCGNSVDGGAALNPAMGNTCVTTSGSHTGDGYDHGRHLSPEHTEAFERYLEERPGRHAVPEQRQESRRHEEARPEASRPETSRPEASRPEASRPAGPRHAKPRHAEPRHEDGYGAPGKQTKEEECDDHPESAPTPPQGHAPPAPDRPHPMPEPAEEHPAPLPHPEPAQEAPAPLPAPAPVEEGPAPRPPHGSQPMEHQAPAPVSAPAPEAVRPADQPPAAPAGDLPVHLPSAPAPAPAPAPVPAPAHVTAPMLAETGAGQPAAAAALATALILGGAILYRRSRIS
ncbi:chaplin family protein [Streptomyces sp. NPDC054849]